MDETEVLKGEVYPRPPYTRVQQYFEYFLHENVVIHHKPALITENSQITFMELNELANRLARCLKKNLTNIGNISDKNKCIAILMPPSEHLVIIIFAILKVDVAYLPLNFQSPFEPVARILRQAQPLCLITNDTHSLLMEQIEDFFENELLIFQSDQLLKEQSVFKPDDLKESDILKMDKNNERLFSVMFTSGNTGVPKGIKIPHKAVMNRLTWQWKTFPYTEDDICCFKTTIIFVDSITEIFGPLLQGVTLVIIPRQITQNPQSLVTILEKNNITRLILVPSLLRAVFQFFRLLQNKNRLSTISIFICSGEKLPVEILNEFFEYFPSGHSIANYYGSTEVMGDVTFELFESNNDVLKKLNNNINVSIGRPIFNTIIYLLNEDLQPVPLGELGEICVSGLNVVKGYLKGGEAKFLKNHLTDHIDHSIIFRTGDYGRIVRGMLFYEGRSDYQIKVSGQRVDLNEVESALEHIEGISHCVVLCKNAGDPRQVLIGFYVTKRRLSKDYILQSLNISLAPHMIPYLMEVGDIPFLENQKVDQRTLIAMYTDHILKDASSLTADNEIERMLLLTVKKITQAHDITLSKSFFQVGGTSLNTIDLIWALKEQGYEITIEKLVEAKTLKEVALELRVKESEVIPQSQTKLFKIVTLSSIDKSKGVAVVSKGLTYKGDLERYTNPQENEYEMFIGELWEQACNDGYSFGVLNKKKLVGISVNFDFTEEPIPNMQPPACIEDIASIMEELEGNVFRDIPEIKGTYLHNIFVATNIKLETKEKLQIVHAIEEENLLMARRNGFKGMVTTNTNRLTQQLCCNVFGYEIRNKIQVNEFVDKKNKKPFKKAPNSFIVYTVVKTF